MLVPIRYNPESHMKNGMKTKVTTKTSGAGYTPMRVEDPSQEQPHVACQERVPASGNLEVRLRLRTLVQGTCVSLLASPGN